MLALSRTGEAKTPIHHFEQAEGHQEEATETRTAPRTCKGGTSLPYPTVTVFEYRTQYRKQQLPNKSPDERPAAKVEVLHAPSCGPLWANGTDATKTGCISEIRTTAKILVKDYDGMRDKWT
uniref:Uncharacterized protein n=1 Tax=Pristionchus pacificus TaxID=54126 RepID=A0A2A6C5Q7_PRIPA|eukprot:PDM73437.1 hypothetical protein PRIPAC_40793 [Pristionchus pacificus]